MNTGLVSHEKYFWYDSLNQAFPPFQIQPGGNPDGPETKRRILSLLNSSNYATQMQAIAPRMASADEVLRVHSQAYYQQLQVANQSLAGEAGPGAIFAGGHLDIAMLSAGGVLSAVDAVIAQVVRNAYALVRPPGHHAETDRGAGFCVLNNAAIAARHVQQNAGIERVAIIDWDVHHGNGAQEIFWTDPSVLTLSVHQDYYFLEENFGTLAHNGEGHGAGFNINVPLPPGCGDVTYSAVMKRVIEPALKAFEPDFIIVACGLDAGCYDPLGRMALTPDGFKSLASDIFALAESFCDGRLVLCQEGGYDLASTPYMALGVLEGLSGVESNQENPFQVFGSTIGCTDTVLPHQEEVIIAAEQLAAQLSKRQ